MTVTFSATDRQIRLSRGRVWFDVARDGRQFRVVAGAVEARDIGTAFAVERASDRITVTVEQGRVFVTSDVAAPPVTLDAGQSVSVERGLPSAPRNVDPETMLAWHRGLIVFDRASLGAVAEELDRMRPGRVLVTDESLRKLVLSGVFRADDPDAIIGALRDALGVKTTTIPGLATLIHR